MADNPFAALLPTPEALDLQRRAEFAARSQGQDFFVQEAGLAGLGIRKSLMERGVALSREDERALTGQRILEQSQRRLAELVESGVVDPLDAQEAVINDAMSAFMREGDFRAAQSFLPALNQIRTYRAELDKLRSETGENIAQTQKERQLGAKAATEAVAVASKLPAQITELESKADLNKARADLARRTDPNLRRGPAGGSDDVLKSTKAKFEEQMLGGAAALHRLGQLTSLVLENPGVGSSTAESLAKIQDETRGAAALTRQTADAFTNLQNNQLEDRSNARIETERKRTKLNIAFGEFRSLVIDLAYSLARARDPGGRLSDADIENALKIVGAAGDPQRMVTVMKTLAENTYKDLARNRSRGEFFRTSGVNEELDREFAAFNSVLDSFSKKPAPDAGTAKSRTRDELLNEYRK